MIENIIEDIARKRAMNATMRMVMQRESEFSNQLEAQLTGVAFDPNARAYFENRLDEYWNEIGRFNTRARASAQEVIIGSGFHAAVYAAIRVKAGFPKPTVVERGRPGGTFAAPGGPAFFLNSRNRPGGLGIAGDQGINPNYLPGAPVQTASIGIGDYQTNDDISFVIRATLAKYANVIPGFEVASVERESDNYRIIPNSGSSVRAYRIIDARGIGDPSDKSDAPTVETFPNFMERMNGNWPLRGIKRAAVIGAGDGARCALEALLGVGPQPRMSIPMLDSVERVDAYGNLPTTYEGWCEAERGRYLKIGRFLRPDRFGVKRLNVFRTFANPVPIPGAALINGRSYDLVILATGNRQIDIPGLPSVFNMDTYEVGSVVVGKRGYRIGQTAIYRVGPHADLSFSSEERDAGIANIRNNAVSMFRLAGKTAALAATLQPAADEPVN